MHEQNQDELITRYKLHARFIDNLQRQIDTSDKFYMSIVITLIAGFVLLVRDPIDSVSPEALRIGVLVVGFVFCLLWLINVFCYSLMFASSRDDLRSLEEKIDFFSIRNNWPANNLKYSILHWVRFALPFLMWFILRTISFIVIPS